MNTVKSIVEILRANGGRMFFPFDRCGWMQYDTDQDAHYFGVWVNPGNLCVLTYAEGDWSYDQFENADAYNAQIRRMNEFYGAGFIAKALSLDSGEMTVYAQDRESEFYA